MFDNAVAAMEVISGGELPEMIFMEVRLTGPDGFTFLNEMVSYADTAKVPVVIVSGMDFHGADLGAYGVVGVLDKETMRPEDVRNYVLEYALTGVEGELERR